MFNYLGCWRGHHCLSACRDAALKLTMRDDRWFWLISWFEKGAPRHYITHLASFRLGQSVTSAHCIEHGFFFSLTNPKHTSSKAHTCFTHTPSHTHPPFYRRDTVQYCRTAAEIFDIYFPWSYPNTPPQVRLLTTGGHRSTLGARLDRPMKNGPKQSPQVPGKCLMNP